MTAVMERTEEQQAIINAFKMPLPKRGQQVLWYQHCNKQEAPEIGFVRKINNRSIVVSVGGVCLETTPHIDDPRLTLNDDQRAGGAWDFPESERDLATLKEQVSRLTAEVAALKSLFDEPAKKGK